jgi:hypothetical protein
VTHPGLALLAIAAVGCAGARDRDGVAGARGWYYGDNSGVDVATVAVEATEPVAAHTAVTARALLDRVRLRRTQIDPSTIDPGGEHGEHGGHTGHGDHAPDVVTSASALVGDGAVADEDRWEGRLRLEHDGGAETPWRTWAGARASTEPDYLAWTATAGASIELAERNTAVGAEVGYGRDRVEPVEAPPGQQAAWPAHHDRITASLSVSQVASPAVLLSAGAAVTRQRGELASPYRRALVRTTLFPEVVPDERDRATAFVAASAAISARLALHLRAGAYRDSWGVWALIPEVAVGAELATDLLATISYRHYRQRAADFHRAVYDRVEPLLSGDPRLGPIAGHTAGGHLAWTVRGSRGDAGAITVDGGYQVVVLDIPLATSQLVVGHQVVLGVTGVHRWFASSP